MAQWCGQKDNKDFREKAPVSSKLGHCATEARVREEASMPASDLYQCPQG